MMMQRYLAFAATTPVLLLSSALTGLLLAWVFPSLPLGGPLLDTLPGYSPSQARELLVQYGVDGRRLYAVASPTLDTLLPICYVTFFAGAVHRCGLPERVGWLAVLPVVVGVWDLLENLQITLLLLGYPDVSDRQIQWASFFTWVKGSVLIPAVSLLLVLAVVYRVQANLRSR